MPQTAPGLRVGVFEKADCIKQQSAHVQCFAKSKINPRRWQHASIGYSILVMTAQQLVNLLGCCGALLQQIDLLVSKPNQWLLSTDDAYDRLS